VAVEASGQGDILNVVTASLTAENGCYETIAYGYHQQEESV